MKRLSTFLLVSLVILVALVASAKDNKDKLGLMIIAHGSPVPAWNVPVLALEQEVTAELKRRGGASFEMVRVALMEFTSSTIAEVSREMEGAGIDRVYSLPLFIAPSGHSLYDVPTILGLYSDDVLRSELQSEGIEIVDSGMRITVGPSLHHGDVLREIILDRVRELSTDPASEGVVLLAHGDRHFEPHWDALSERIGRYICANTGIQYFDYAYVHVGQDFATEGVSAIDDAAKEKERVIVPGLFVSMGVDKMAPGSSIGFHGMVRQSEEMLEDVDVHYATRGLLPDPRIAAWIADRAEEWMSAIEEGNDGKRNRE